MGIDVFHPSCREFFSGHFKTLYFVSFSEKIDFKVKFS
jgi:hypothetical protein